MNLIVSGVTNWEGTTMSVSFSLDRESCMSTGLPEDSSLIAFSIMRRDRNWTY
ncbi:MAG: hypothetical protein M1267_00045 [Candidatus Thermoplasmatota archaeon]|nr:hypothetical protein [Candidatus Thermoplasmatota archaeon]